ncbi:hypothetical protein RHGRI_021510 [Rhododendron griersonianum]|uniref:Transducin/WD40 repeat-like superfamily protein n=1 Tax=Rhododendron griersonianum TaxID=479676 RepID=A0AAV6JKG3_9ERIC|nr:hypothetical protein RHGRI_021510 [Rhododendron griersonianum]
MEQFQNHNLEFMVEDYHEMTDFNDILFEDTESPREGTKPKTDTSALEARNGRDIQGIPWERLNFNRDRYRETRLKLYKNYENLSRSPEELIKVGVAASKPLQRQLCCSRSPVRVMNLRQMQFFLGKWECTEAETCHNFYDFQFNTRLVKSTIVHFQLRNLVWATSKHDVYLMQNYSLMHWSSLLRRGKEVLNVAKPIEPTQFLSQPGVAFSTKLATDENAITNAVDIYHNSNGSIRVMTANNDAHVRVFDAGNFACLSRFSFPWSVNNTSVSPDGKLMAVLGDSVECLVADTQSGKVGFYFYLLQTWHPDGQIFATGNQDTTCRLWDIRNLSQSITVLKGRMGAIRAIQFTSDGRFMAMAEAADFVHIFDTQSAYAKVQEIDLFGEIAGISFSPDTEALFVGVADRTYGSLLEFNRRHYNYYLNSIL